MTLICFFLLVCLVHTYDGDCFRLAKIRSGQPNMWSQFLVI